MAYDTDDKLDIDEDELLQLVLGEFRSSIGFEFDADLIGQRERATNYAKGIMPDVPALPGRSRAVSTDVADVVETALPQLIDIFTGDDVIAFRPVGEEDEEAAKQETAYVRHVFFEQNDGFRVLETYLRDALYQKTGLIMWYWEEAPEPEVQQFDGKNAIELQALAKSFPNPQQFIVTPADDVGEDGQPLYDVEVTPAKKEGKCCIDAIDPADFTVARDANTSDLSKVTYCAYRSRPRAQELKAMDIDAELVDALPTWTLQTQNASQLARDTVSESLQQVSGNIDDLRQVLVVVHFLRLMRDGKERVYRVITDWANATVLKAHKVNRISIAAGGPFMNAHRFYHSSLADKAIEGQRIKTALTRALLDSAYFAINQRPIINTQMSNDMTEVDVLNNVPGAVIRVDGPPSEALQMFGGQALNFDPLEQLEYFSTQVEQRTGVLRSNQGLDPDTLHDTATGALAMLNNSQRRIRMMARNLAEGIKDALLGIHATLCENATQAAKFRLNNNWVPVDPRQWTRRDDMVIEIGEGAGNSQHDIVMAQQLGGVITQLVQAQGGPNGPLATPRTITATAEKMIASYGFKRPEQYLPQEGEYQPPQQQQDPAIVKAQMDAQAKAQQLQLDQAKAAADHQNAQQQLALQAQSAEAEQNAKDAQLTAEITLKHAQIQAEIELKKYEIDANIQLEREKMALQASLERDKLAHAQQQHSDNVSVEGAKLQVMKDKLSSNVRPGGEPG